MSGRPADAECWLTAFPAMAVLAREVQRRTSRSATEVAILFALYPVTTVTVCALRRRLAADAGQVSRIMAGFTGEGLVILGVSAVDHRRREVTLTASGRRYCTELALTVAEAAREVWPALSAGNCAAAGDMER